jgi:hypothetical protein
MGYAERQDSARLIAWDDVVHHTQDRLLITSSIAFSLESVSSVKAAYILSSSINWQADNGLAYLFKIVEASRKPCAPRESGESVGRHINSVLRRQMSADVDNTDKTF